MNIKFLFVAILIFNCTSLFARLPHKVPTESEFKEVIAEVLEIYQPMLKKPLRVEQIWEDEGSSFARDKGDHFSLHMATGFYRMKDLTRDGFLLIVCHEIGHLHGGAPLYGEKAVSTEETTLSVEGQSDYWAASKCFRRVKQKSNNVEFIKNYLKLAEDEFSLNEIIPASETLCNEHWKNGSDNDRALCRRIIFAGHNFSRATRVVQRERYWVNITTPSKIIVKETFPFHLTAQCRFDTYVAAALCTVPLENKVSSQDPKNAGSCTRENYSPAQSRPICWFKP